LIRVDPSTRSKGLLPLSPQKRITQAAHLQPGYCVG
jgi:hypothetical protein